MPTGMRGHPLSMFNSPACFTAKNVIGFVAYL